MNQASMITACKTGDVETVRQLLRDDPSLVEFDNPVGRFAPLHYAARAGHADCVRVLIEAGASPNPFEHMLRNHCGTTTIELARLRGYTEVVALLEAAIAAKHAASPQGGEIHDALKNFDMPRIMALVEQSPKWVHATDDDGNTPLHRAAQMRPVNLSYLGRLLALGADQNALNFLGFRPIHLTLFRNHAWTCKMEDWRGTGFLLGSGADYSFCLACAAGDTEQVKAMLAADSSLTHSQETFQRRPLSIAAEFQRWDIVELLLEHGADPNAQESKQFKTYPVVAATDANNYEIVKLLLEHGADAEAWVDAAPSALNTAVTRGYTEIANLLAANGASISPSAYAWDCNIPVLSALLKANRALAAELLAFNDESKPEQSKMVVDLAFKHGADPKEVGAWTLYRACDTPLLLKAFLDHGVDPNTADKEGKTTLHGMNRFSKPGTVECAGLLLDYGADIHARDDIHQGTPLMWAALFGNKPMTEFLLSRGAQPSLPDDQPWATPLFWAELRGHTEIAKLLREHGVGIGGAMPCEHPMRL